MKKLLKLKIVFWLLVATFLAIISELFISRVRELFRNYPPFLFLTPIIIFFLLGLILIFLTIKEGIKGKLRKFLILTGACSAGFFICVFLHNFVYGLFIYLFGSGFWINMGLDDEPLFFFLAIFVCPIGFLIGLIGSLRLFVKERDSL